MILTSPRPARKKRACKNRQWAVFTVEWKCGEGLTACVCASCTYTALWNPAVPVPPPRENSRFPDPFPVRFSLPQNKTTPIWELFYFVEVRGIEPRSGAYTTKLSPCVAALGHIIRLKARRKPDDLTGLVSIPGRQVPEAILRYDTPYIPSRSQEGMAGCYA